MNEMDAAVKSIDDALANIHRQRAMMPKLDDAEKRLLQAREKLTGVRIDVDGVRYKPRQRRESYGRRQDTEPSVLEAMTEMPMPATVPQVLVQMQTKDKTWRYGQIKSVLAKLVDEGSLVRVKRGLYDWDRSQDTE